MNGGSFRGEAYGYQLEALLKIKDTRANNQNGSSEDLNAKPDQSLLGVSTLLHYLIRISDSSSSDCPGFVDFMEEMAHVEPASRVSMQALQTQVKTLKSGMVQLENEIKALKNMSLDSNDRFLAVMQVSLMFTFGSAKFKIFPVKLMI
jgi:hypothetical protein